eukprot:Tamp_21210.p1 GENE.Tamp_21210~~Tamp_21210.p1  ORF type:complete len:219 (+),score=31.73 Tamp_21210:51-659(+)
MSSARKKRKELRKLLVCVKGVLSEHFKRRFCVDVGAASEFMSKEEMDTADLQIDVIREIEGAITDSAASISCCPPAPSEEASVEATLQRTWQNMMREAYWACAACGRLELSEMTKTLRLERQIQRELGDAECSVRLLKGQDSEVFLQVSRIAQTAERLLSRTHFLAVKAKTLLFAKATALRLTPIQAATSLGVVRSLASKLA